MQVSCQFHMPGLKRQWSEAYHSSPSRLGIKSTWNYYQRLICFI